jgi:hypothetical protein
MLLVLICAAAIVCDEGLSTLSMCVRAYVIRGCVTVCLDVQDFLQVLSMFAGFRFDWPPAVMAVYNVFSLINFNFELLAPECSLSVNFETKW